MLTYDETYNLVQGLNEEAHNLAWNTWMQAEEAEHEGDDEEAEETREQASAEQAGYFRDLYRELDEDQQQAVRYWLEENQDFRDEFSTWFGEDEFFEQFDEDQDATKH